MPVVASDVPCMVCEKNFAVMHEHHTVPQCCGGVNSKRVILCGTCHNAVHAHALHVYRALKSNKGVSKKFWDDPRCELRATPLVRLIVDAFAQRNISGVTDDQLVTVHTDVPVEVYRQLKAIQKDAGLSSLEKTLAYCIRYVFSQKGLKSGNEKLWYQNQTSSRKLR